MCNDRSICGLMWTMDWRRVWLLYGAGNKANGQLFRQTVKPIRHHCPCPLPGWCSFPIQFGLRSQCSYILATYISFACSDLTTIELEYALPVHNFCDGESIAVLARAIQCVLCRWFVHSVVCVFLAHSIIFEFNGARIFFSFHLFHSNQMCHGKFMP